MRVVLDTNVLVSGVAGMAVPGSVPGQIIRAWRAGRFDLVSSPHILAEFARAMATPYFGRRLTAAQVASAVALLSNEAIIVSPGRPIRRVVSDPNDDAVLATTVAGGATLLVTGDRELQGLRSYQTVAVLSPRAFLSMLGEAVDS